MPRHGVVLERVGRQHQPTAVRFFFSTSSKGRVCAVAGPLTFLPRIESFVPWTATGTSRRGMAIDFPVKVDTMAQVTTPTFLSPEYTGSPISAGALPSTSKPKILKRSFPFKRKWASAPLKSFLPGLTVKSRPSSHRVSPGGSLSKGYICDMSDG